jgi:hypothetical protein
MGQQVVQLLVCWVMYCTLFFLRETLAPVENCLFHVSSSEKKVVKPVHVHLNQTHIHTRMFAIGLLRFQKLIFGIIWPCID